MTRLLFLGAMIAALGHASTVSLSPIADGRGTIGDPADFMVVNGSITTNNTGSADILLNFNYRTKGAGGPATDLGGFMDFGALLNVGDLLFQVGAHNYGIAIADHSGSPNGANASLFASVVHGNFYASSALLDAQTVLNNVNADYRKNKFVWLGSSVTNLGALAETVTFNGGSTPKYTVELKGQLPAAFLADVNAQGGVSVEFGSATCANGYLVGTQVGTLGTATPEPLSLTFMGSGLLALALLRRRRGSIL